MKEAALPRLRLDFNALRGRRAVSRLTYAIAGVGLFLSSFEFEVVLPKADNVDAFVIATATTAATLLVLLAADKTILRTRFVRPLPLAVVLGVYVVCGIVRAIVNSISAAAVDAQGAELTVRSLGGVVLVVAWFSIIAVVLDYTDRDRKTTMQLRSRQAQLTKQRDHYSAALAEGRTTIADLVDAVAGPAIEQSESMMRRIGTDGTLNDSDQAAQLSELAFELRDRAEGQVRTLSHLLHSAEAQFEDDELVPRIPTVARLPDSRWLLRALKQATVLDPIQPTAVTLTVLIEAIPLLVYAFGFGGLIQCTVIGAPITFLFLVLARRVITPNLRRWNQGARVAVLFGVAAGSGLLATGCIYLWWPAEPLVTAAIGLRCVWMFTVAIAVWAVIASSAAQSIRTQRELAATIAEIEWQTQQLREDLSRVQRSAGEIVHGRVQGRIVAAAMVLSMQSNKLAQGQPSAAEQTPIALAEATAILGEARDDIRSIQHDDDVANSLGIVDLLDTVGRAWRGVVDVDVHVSPAAVAAINDDDRLGTRIAEILREAVSNAARHGAARSIAIELSLSNQLLQITAVDDGLGVKSEIEPGLGLSQISRAHGDWHLQAGPDRGAVLTVSLPLR